MAGTTRSRRREKAAAAGDPAAVHVLAASLDLTRAAELAKQLSDLRGADLAVDASGVERIGTQCMQVLLSAARSWHDDGAEFSIVRPSEAFAGAVRLLGLHSAFRTKEHGA